MPTPAASFEPRVAGCDFFLDLFFCFSYDLYEASSGKLLRAGLALTGYPFDEQQGPHTEIKIAKPSTLYFIQYVESRHELDQEFRLILFRLKDALRGNARMGG